MISYKNILKAWDKFFFEERPTEGLALFRIVYMTMIFFYFLLDVGNVVDFYGPHAIISLETARREFPWVHANLFFLFNVSYEFTYLLMAVYGLSIVCSILGLFTRYSLLTALICMVSFQQRNIWLLSSSETLMRLILVYLVVSPCGHTLSVDAILGRKFVMFKQKRSWPIWSLRLIQIQISVVYLWTVWHKLKGNAWFDGSAVYFATRLENMSNFTIPFIMDSKLILKLLTWGTLAIEIALATLVWIKEFRRPVIFAGLLFHLGIEWVMCIPFFEINMMILLMNFFTPEEMRNFVQRNIDVVIRGLQESPIAVNIKEKLISTLRGQHETVN